MKYTCESECRSHGRNTMLSDALVRKRTAVIERDALHPTLLLIALSFVFVE